MIYAISDIHGQLKAFENILSQINLTKNDCLYILGDYVDWGNNSMEVIKKCMNLEEKGLAKCLLGNHDLMFLNQLKKDISHYGFGLGQSPVIDSCWANNGGLETYFDYSQLTKEDKEKIYNWLDNLPYTVEGKVNDKNVLFAHSEPFTQLNKNDFDYINYRDEAVWNRELCEYDSKTQINYINSKYGDNKGFKITPESDFKIYDYYVHGHTPTNDFGIKQNDYEINVDCCAKLIGYDYDIRCCLGCINLTTKEMFYSYER